MAKVSLILDTRKKSKSRITGLYLIVLKVFHKKNRLLRIGHCTSLAGWDSKNHLLRKSSLANNGLDYQKINAELGDKLHWAKQVVYELGDSIDRLDVDLLLDHIKVRWDSELDFEIKKKVENNITLSQWGSVLINRKRVANIPGTAPWYQSGVDAMTKFNNGKDMMLYDITLTFLRDFEAQPLKKGNSKNTIGMYIRAIRSIYNSTIKEDEFVPLKNPFDHYRTPSKARTKKKAVTKVKIMDLKKLEYEEKSPLWHAKNYALIMFYCRGYELNDLVKLMAKNIEGDRLLYGRSKTGDPFSVRITESLGNILEFYLKGKQPEDYLLPTNYDGSTNLSSI
ncbi:phage integrase SAM-like domain-containing protein [Arenibacter sp. F26102]|uniref:phage integrase SAM-like domain-containing protein n=1 Tax=Arenibacter sp. F26102 TaxID=2926416 RepID=UPI001FF2FF80|nr:phage integrase SAM-like domain-containing protein [Arenibacter sp. F26102]MCK0148346.1 phage integrase SAM-like domain-containing protein [Arenibacter sp. F26102]